MGTCPLLSDAIAARDSLKEATEAAEAAEKRLEAVTADAEAAQGQIDRYTATTQQAAAERQQYRQTQQQELDSITAQLRTAKASCDEARRAVERTADLQTQLQLSTQRIEMLQEVLAGLDDKIGEAEGLRLVIDQEREVVRLLLGDVFNLKTTAKSSLDTVTEAESELARVRALVESANKTRAECLVLDKQSLAHERRRAAAAFYLEAVQRQGIPSLLLRQLAPQLQARINDILAPAGRQIRINCDRDLTTGKTKTEVNLEFNSPTSRGEWVPIAELSGGEEDLANAAWAIGLARVAADMTATPLGLVILDEPFTGVSAEYEEPTREILGHIQEHVERVMIITHKRDLMPMVDSSLVLSQNGAGTTVELVR